MAAIIVPSAGDSITATWGSSVADALNTAGCVIIKTTDQSIPDATDRAVTFATGNVTEELDTDAFHNPAVNSGERIVIPSGMAGWYDIGACAIFASDPDGYRSLWIELNGKETSGTQLVRSSHASAGGATFTALTVSTFYLFAAADYITMNVRHTAGAATALTATAYAPRMWCMRRNPTA